MKPPACIVCHRTSPAEGEFCADCDHEFYCVVSTDVSPRLMAAWAADRAWKFAVAEVEAAVSAARRVEGRPGDPGRSRRRR